MLHGRKRLSTAISSTLVGLAAVAVATGPAAPSHAEPSIGQVERRVDRLYHEAEVAQERHHDASIMLDRLVRRLGDLRAAQVRQRDRVQLVRESLQDSVVRQYEGESISTVGQVMVSDDPDGFLAQLTAVAAFTDIQAGLYDDYATQLDALERRRQVIGRRTDQVSRVEHRLAAERATVRERLAQAKDLLAELEQEERERLFAAQTSPSAPVPSSVDASGGAAAAVQFALAQVGDAYVYGAAGPDAFDCSGLTMTAWAAARVGLPHSSSAQFGSGTPVSYGELQPGDLVFYYSPISHVGIYIGNGLIVDAANPGTGVRVAGVSSMPFSGAVRPG